MIKYSDFMELISKNKVATTQEQYNITMQVVSDVFKLIQKYINKHGEVAISCGSEWMYQDDRGQIDALELVGDILDKLSVFAENDDEDE